MYATTHTITGQDGSVWVVSDADGDFGDDGAELDVDPKGIYQNKFTTRWINGAFQVGGRYVGKEVPQRDVVLPFNLYDQGDGIEDTVSRFRKAWSSDAVTRYSITSDISGERWLDLRLTSQIELSTSTDMNLSGFVRAVVSATAGQPMYESAQQSNTFVNPSSGQNVGYIPVSNPTDQKLWLRWSVTAPCKASIPDFSWGQTDLEEINGRDPGEDADRMIVCPQQNSGQAIDIDTDPDVDMVICEDKSNFWGLFGGIAFMYPVPPYTPLTQVPVVLNGPAGAAITCYQRRLWSAEAGME